MDGHCALADLKRKIHRKHLFISTGIAQTAFHDGDVDYYQSYMWLPCVNRVPAILTPPYCLQDDSVFSPALKIARKPCEGKSKGKYNKTN